MSVPMAVILLPEDARINQAPVYIRVSPLKTDLPAALIKKLPITSARTAPGSKDHVRQIIPVKIINASRITRLPPPDHQL